MKSNINVTVIEHPGKIGQSKAAELSRKLQRLLSIPEFRVEVEKRIAENKKEVTNVTE